MEKPHCDIPNCRRVALKTSIFCSKHDKALLDISIKMDSLLIKQEKLINKIKANPEK